MSVKSQQVTKGATANRAQAAPAVVNRARGSAGNHTVLNANERDDELNSKKPGASADIPYLTIDGYKELATAMYVGGKASLPSEDYNDPAKFNYNNRGILDSKLDGIDAMRAYLDKEDAPSIEERILESVLKVGVTAGAAALAAEFSGAAIAAVIAGGAEVVLEIPNFFKKDSKNPIDVTAFSTNLKGAVRNGWPKSIATLLSKITDEKTARQVALDVKAAQEDSKEVVRIQENEVLDEWLNAVNYAKSGGKGSGQTQGMGQALYGTKFESEVVPGRVELRTAALKESDYSSGPKFTFMPPILVRVGGLPTQRLRDMLADRKLSDIKVARTMRVFVSSKEGGWGITLKDNIAVGISPTGEMSLAEGEQSKNFAKGILASYYTGKSLDADEMWVFEGEHDQPEIDKVWDKGLTKVWEQVLDKKLKELNNEEPIIGE